LTNSKRWDGNSSIREFGSEAYFQASLFSELEKLAEDYQDLILGVENKNLAGKRPDILGGRGESGLAEPEFVIELKVTGTDLLEPFSKSEFGFLMDEIKRYAKSDRLAEGKALFFFGCYYESKPEDILSLVNEYGSVVNWLINERELEINKEFLTQIVEGYAFRGSYNWLLVDNEKENSYFAR
jgi:hypothetical protein